MLPTLLAAVTLGGIATPEVERWEIHSELVLPRPLWLVEGDVMMVRVTEVALDLELACAATDDDARKVSCVISDVAIRGAAMPGDEDKVALALVQADERLTGAVLDIAVKDGRIRGVDLDLDPSQRVRRTTRARDENLRLIVSRAIAGFDLEDLPLEGGGVHGQRRTWLAQMPSGRGTRASGATVHQVGAGEPGYRVVSQAQLTLATDMLDMNGVPSLEDTFRGELRAEAFLADDGRLLKRRWAMQVEPTASSDLADGPAGLPYLHTGNLRRLGDEAADIGETGRIEATHRQPTALQSQVSLGIPPGAWNR